MRKRQRNSATKTRKLLNLYSKWHETHDEDVQAECLKALGQVLHSNPGFRLRNEFRGAF